VDGLEPRAVRGLHPVEVLLVLLRRARGERELVLIQLQLGELRRRVLVLLRPMRGLHELPRGVDDLLLPMV
jgi:hypothetical protein